MELANQPGIYALVFPKGVYVGSSVHARRRVLRHLNDLRRGQHCNPKLQRAFAKYGAPEGRALLYCNERDLIAYEQMALEGLCPRYNLAPTAGRNLGHRHSPETLKRMREAGREAWKKRSRIVGPDQRRRISASLKGREFSEETRARISAAKKGYRHTEEAKRKVSAAKRGVPLSPQAMARRMARLAREKAEKANA